MLLALSITPMGVNSKCGVAIAADVKSKCGSGVHYPCREESLIDQANVRIRGVDLVGDIEDVCTAVILKDEIVPEPGQARHWLRYEFYSDATRMSREKMEFFGEAWLAGEEVTDLSTSQRGDDS